MIDIDHFLYLGILAMRLHNYFCWPRILTTEANFHFFTNRKKDTGKDLEIFFTDD